MKKKHIRGSARGLGFILALLWPASAVLAQENVGAKAETPEASYSMRLREIQEKVNDLKEKIHQSKTKLQQLQEVVLHGTITGSKAVLVHRNEMGSSFKLWRIQYALDGAPIFNRVDNGEGDLDKEGELEIFNGSVTPGTHKISVFLEYHGNGFGIFSYLEGYRFKIKSSYSFEAEEGRKTKVNIVGYEKGGFTTPLQERPSVRYDLQQETEKRAGVKAAE